jgi:hypothetical protein
MRLNQFIILSLILFLLPASCSSDPESLTDNGGVAGKGDSTDDPSGDTSPLDLHKDKHYLVFHAYEGSIDEFLKRNPKGGFITYDEKLFYAHPAAVDAKEILKHLEVDAKSGQKILQLPDWLAYNVTNSAKLTARSKTLQGRFSVYDGPRCFDAVLFSLGYSKGVMGLGPDGFVNWAKSPMARKISEDELQAGDVIAVDEGDVEIPMEHVAIFESDLIVFQKGSPEAQSPFEFLTWEMFQQRYPRNELKYKFFRPVMSLDAYLQTLSDTIPESIKTFLRKSAEIETKMPSYFLTRRDDPKFPFDLPEAEQDKWARDYHAENAAVRDLAGASEAELKPVLEGLPSTLKTVRDMINVRLSSFWGYPDPYD